MTLLNICTKHKYFILSVLLLFLLGILIYTNCKYYNGFTVGGNISISNSLELSNTCDCINCSAVFDSSDSDGGRCQYNYYISTKEVSLDDYSPSDITKIHINHCSSINSNLCAFKNLKGLYIELSPSLNLKTTDFCNMNKLTELHIHGINIENLPVGIFDSLNNLTILKLYNNNKIEKLPEGIFDSLNNLTKLDLYNNNIENLPEGIFDSLNNLTELDLSNNKIEILPVHIFDSLNNLTELDLHENNIEILPVGIFDSLNNLTKLDLSKNRIQELKSYTFSSLSLHGTYIEINLSNNAITTINEYAFYKLSIPHPGTLNLSNNASLTTIKGNAFYKSNINVIELIGNSNLTKIEPFAFNELQMSSLKLNKNGLTTINENAFYGLSATFLYINENNSLTTINENAFYNTYLNGNLDLRNNRSLNMIQKCAFNGLNFTGSGSIELNNNKSLMEINHNAFNGINARMLTRIHIEEKLYNDIISNLCNIQDIYSGLEYGLGDPWNMFNPGTCPSPSPNSSATCPEPGVPPEPEPNDECDDSSNCPENKPCCIYHEGRGNICDIGNHACGKDELVPKCKNQETRSGNDECPDRKPCCSSNGYCGNDDTGHCPVINCSSSKTCPPEIPCCSQWEKCGKTSAHCNNSKCVTDDDCKNNPTEQYCSPQGICRKWK